MKASRSLVVVAAFVVTQAVLAQGTATPPPMDKKVMAMDAKTAIVQGVRLSKICDACGVVGSTRMEKRKGDAKGVGAVSGAVVGGVVGNKVGDSTTSTVVGAGVGGVLGPLNRDESGTLLFQFRARGFKDAFVQYVE